jgi:hypothetical protein
VFHLRVFAQWFLLFLSYFAKESSVCPLQ